MHGVRRVALILNTVSPYQRKIIRGVAAYARDAGCWSLYVEEDPLDKLPNLRMWHGHGIIGSFEQNFSEAVRGVSIPVVGVEGGHAWYDQDSGIPYFNTDDEAIARMAIEHFIDQGLSRLAYCGMPGNRYNVWSRNRGRAFRRQAREAGLTCAYYVGHSLSVRKWNELQRSLARWLRSLKKPVGVLAANDARARHLLEACRTIGARVPDDVAVIGVDNDELMCELTDPPLTSIEQGARSVGYGAAALLDKLMSGKKASQIANYVPPERIVCRRSTDSLAIEDEDVADAVRFIRQHAWEHIRVADIVDAVNVSRSTLELRFQKIMHRTIHSEIQRVMILRAQQLIAAGGMSLKQVAAEAGFAHVQHMTNLFRQRLDQTPSEFQRMAQLGLPTLTAASERAE